MRFEKKDIEEDSPYYDPVILSGNRNQSQTTIHGWPSFFFGIPFAGVGAAGLLMMAGVIPVAPEKINGPQWMIWIFAGFFLFAGLSFMTHGLKGALRRKAIEQLKRRRATSPWEWDFAWSRIGFSRPKWKKPAKTFTMFFIFLVFLAPFNWWAFVSGEKSFILYFVVGLFDLLTVGIFCQFVYHFLQYLKYGTSRILFFAFPFHLGGVLKVGLEGLPNRALIEDLELNLRFIEERYEVRGTGKNRRSEVVCYQKYLDRRKLKAEEIPLGPVFEMEWPLPDNADYVTRLSERPARFWELEVKASTPGVDYDEQFLLPVYERP